MYTHTDFFASATTTVTVNIEEDESIFIRIHDSGFGASVIVERDELSELLGKYDKYTFHNGIRFPSFTFFDAPNGKVDELKMTLEMI